MHASVIIVFDCHRPSPPTSLFKYFGNHLADESQVCSIGPSHVTKIAVYPLIVHLSNTKFVKN